MRNGFFSLEEAQGELHHFLQQKEVLLFSATPALRGPQEMALREDSD